MYYSICLVVSALRSLRCAGDPIQDDGSVDEKTLSDLITWQIDSGSHADGRRVSVRAKMLSTAAAFSFFRGDNSRAAALFEESLTLLRQLGDKRSILFALNGLGHVSLAQHRYPVVQRVGEENLLLARELSDRWKAAEALYFLTYGYLAQGEYDKARTVGEECLVLSREFSVPGCLAHAIYAVGRVAYKQNDLAVASSLYQESLAYAIEVNDQWLITACLIGWGEVVAAQGNHAWAARLWGAEEALHATIRARRSYLMRTPDEDAVAATRVRLGEEAFVAAWAQGRTMSVEQVLAARTQELAPVLAQVFFRVFTAVLLSVTHKNAPGGNRSPRAYQGMRTRR